MLAEILWAVPVKALGAVPVLNHCRRVVRRNGSGGSGRVVSAVRWLGWCRSGAESAEGLDIAAFDTPNNDYF